MKVLAKHTPIMPESFENKELELELTSYINTQFHIVSTFKWTLELQQLLGTDISLAPFNRIRVVRHSKTDQPVRIQFVLDLAERPSVQRTTQTNSIPSTAAIRTIAARNRGIYETKPYKSWLELSQPPEKDIDSEY